MSLARTIGLLLITALALAGFIAGCGGDPGSAELAEGLKELQRGNYTRATVLLEKSINLRPAGEEVALTCNYLGLAAYRFGQIDRAVEQFEESRKRDPRLFEPVYNLGIIMLEGGNFEKAQALFEEAAGLSARDPRPLEYLGHLHLQRKAWPDARRSFYEALEREPGSPSILCGIALSELRIVGVEAAENNLMRALEADPNYPPALYNLGMLSHLTAKSPAQTSGYFQKFIDLAPQDPNAEYARKLLLDLKPLLARAAEERRAESAADAPPAGRPAPPPAPAAPRTVDDMLREARRAAEQKDVAATLKWCREAADAAQRANDLKGREKALTAAVNLCFDQPEVHDDLGRFQLEQGQYAAAQASFRKALELRPGWVQAYRGLASTAVEAREYDAALVTLREGLRSESDNADLLWALAELYDRSLGLPEPAVKAYLDFERLRPNDPRVVKSQERRARLQPEKPRAPAAAATTPAAPARAAGPAAPADPVAGGRRLEIKPAALRNTKAAVQAYNRGTLYQEREDWERAAFYYQNSLQNDDQFVNAYFNLGSVHRATGDLDLAVDAYRNVIRLQPRMAAARYNLALLYIQLEAYDAAQEQLLEVLKVQPNYAPANYALGLVYARYPATTELARRYYRKFIELAPNDPSADSVRTWLKEH
jgi:tetratricopeptide (TPR) repeat protein